jgi:LacI family transcriptional regulator
MSPVSDTGDRKLFHSVPPVSYSRGIGARRVIACSTEVSRVSTMREVAALAGVSAKTVSRVMHNDRYVSADVRTRVEQAIKDLHYVPNTLARTFRSGRDAAIGVAVPDISDPFFATVTEAVVRVARERQAAVFVTSLGNNPEAERPAVETLLGRQVAGLIATPIADDQSYLKSWQDRTAVVFIDRPPAGITADSVVEDDLGGAQTATTHLIGHGHRRIAFIGDERTVPTTALRLDGYHQALREAGLPAAPELIGLGATADAWEMLRRMLASPEPPTAVFSSNARCSIAVVPLLKAMDRPGPAFISFGDFPLANALTPALSAVDQDPVAVGQLAATRLFDRIENPTKRLKRRIVLPVELVTRASCCGISDDVGEVREGVSAGHRPAGDAAGGGRSPCWPAARGG